METTVSFSPEVILSHDQRAQLSHTVATPGFLLIHQIMRAEVDKFVLDLINVGEDDDKAILAKHKLSKAAAVYYQRVTNRLNAEAQQFMHDAGSPTEPIDPTEGMIDLGGSSSSDDSDDSQDIFANLELNEQLVEEELSGE